MSRTFAYFLIVTALALTKPDFALAEPTVPHLIGSDILDKNSQLVPGTPIDKQDTAVLVLACSLQYERPLGSKGQSVAYKFTVYNQGPMPLRYATLTYRFDKGNAYAYLYDLEPNEVREVTWIASATVDTATGALLGEHRPTFFLCGSGPDVAADGSIIEDASMFPHSLPVVRVMVPERDGKPYTPFITTKSQVAKDDSAFVAAAPLQRDAMLERSTFIPDVPPRNLTPVIIASCGGRYDESHFLNYTLSVFNQTAERRDTVQINFSDASGARSAVAITNLQPHEYRTVEWRRPSSTRPRLLLCSIDQGRD
jgi:hypothetical protein